MPKPVRVALRMLVVLAFLAATSLLSGPATRTASFNSPLSDLAVGSVLAAPLCGYKACAKEPGRKTPDCHRTTAATNCTKSSNGCITSEC